MGIILKMSRDKERQLSKEIDVGARLIGADVDEGTGPSNFNSKRFGICSDCTSLKACVSEYGRTFAQCYEFEMLLYGRDPIVNCTKYEKKGEMKLWEMKEIAIILEPHKKKAGF